MFHDGASEDFTNAVLDAYAGVPPIIRRRLKSFAGSQTVIRTVRRAYGTWIGLSTSPFAQRYHEGKLPIEDRALTRLGRHRLVLAEYLSDDFAILPAFVAATLHHEIGHRIDRAISGDNYTHGEASFVARGGMLFSSSGLFLNAIRQDLQDVGWPPPPGQPPPPGFRMSPYLLPDRSPAGQIDQTNWRRAATEIFADLYALRFSTVFDDQRFPVEYRTDLSIFRRAALLVDQAVATFAGEGVMPLNPNPGDYRSGERPVPLSAPTLLQRATRFLAGTEDFEAVGPNAPHPAPPRPP